MEAGGSRLARQGLQQFNLPSTTIPELDVVRALHQTVISLRTALDSSRAELRRLRKIVGNFRGENYIETVAQLSLENHVLRRRILADGKKERDDGNCNDTNTDELSVTRGKTKATTPVFVISQHSSEQEEELKMDEQKSTDESSSSTRPSIIYVLPKMPGTAPSDCLSAMQQEQQEQQEAGTESISAAQYFRDVSERDTEDISFRSASEGDYSFFSDNAEGGVQQASIGGDEKPVESENESEEVDDIEFIFTTDETCSKDAGLQEDLVSITDNETWQQAAASTSQPMPLKYTKAASTDLPICNGGQTGNSSIEEPLSSQSSMDREESVDNFNEASAAAHFSKLWSQCPAVLETDISQCGVDEDQENASKHNAARRNTLAAPSTSYRPIIHRDPFTMKARKGSAPPLRPLANSNSGGGGNADEETRESEAQTDICALPNQWRSESYLAHKVVNSFTTLPSKFSLPIGVTGKLKISDKSRNENRRVMLSDIGFTGMVPELSRSAEHLCHGIQGQGPLGHRNGGHRTACGNRREFIYSPNFMHKGSNILGGLPSPCECVPVSDYYHSKYRGSLTSIPSPVLEVSNTPVRSNSLQANGDLLGAYSVVYQPPISADISDWLDSPDSPESIPSTESPDPEEGSSKISAKRTRSKDTADEHSRTCAGISNYPADYHDDDAAAAAAGENSDDSTQSLLDEAEDYLRQSFEASLNVCGEDCNESSDSKRRKADRQCPDGAEANPLNLPPGVKPYLPKVPQDLKLDHFAKVIGPNSGTFLGRIRYIGLVPALDDIFVAIQLSDDSGSSDGTYRGRRFFICEPDTALFVPFKKVVLAWAPPST